MSLYWLAPILCGALGFGTSIIMKRALLKKVEGKMLENLLLSDQVTKAIKDGIGLKLVELTQDTRTIGEVLDLYLGKEAKKATIDEWSKKLAKVITVELKNSQISNIILGEIKRVLLEKIKLGFITGLMNGSLWDMVEEPMKKAVEGYLDERCQPMLEEKLKERFTMLVDKRMYELGEVLFEKREEISDVMLQLYKNNIVNMATQMATQIAGTNRFPQKQIQWMQLGMSGFGFVCGLLSMLLCLL